MALAVGTRLGAYQIESAIGAGGMGEVYKARDTRLGRTVAIKVLPSHWADAPDMKQRFEREAQVIASLNHPHICTLHDIGREAATAGAPAIDFLVLEYLEGETLAARLERGPLDVDDALQVAMQIADALDKAHRHGIVHRDLKPGNIFLTRAGGPSDPPIAKLLDFGLARLNADQGRLQATPTPSVGQLTTPGAILGTLQYMSPEQLEGADADARSDIFAFGTVVHEMITGRKTFEGQSRVLLMSAIATADPAPLSHTARGVPLALEHIVSMCLAKDPSARWQSARDLLAALELVAEGGADTGPVVAAPAPTRWRLLPALLAAGCVLVAAASVAAAAYLRSQQEPGEIRLRVPISLTAEPVQVATVDHSAPAMALSPDGRTLAFVARTALQEPWALYVRPVGSISPTRLTTAGDNAMPFWSADGLWIGFVADGRLKKVEASGGPAQDLAPAPDFFGGTWNADGTIIFGSSKGLFRVSAQGGVPTPLTTVASTQSGHFWPHFLPDGRRYLYLAWSPKAEDRVIMAGALESKDSTRVMPSESRAAFVEPGFVLFLRESAAYVRRLDTNTMTVSGEPIRIADNLVANAAYGQGPFASSPNGVLAYLHGIREISALGGIAALTPQTAQVQLVWMSRSGGLMSVVGPAGLYRGFEVSPDGNRVAVHRHDGDGGTVLILEPKSVTYLTFDVARDSSNPIWSPRGDRIAYSGRANGKWALYQTMSNGTGTTETLFESEYPLAPYSWSPDGTRIVFGVIDPKTGSDLWVYSFEGDKKPTVMLNSAEHESAGQISHDGRWLAYVTTLNGRKEVFVRPFPIGSGQWQVSTGGGDRPRWGLEDRELLFHELTVTGGLFSTVLSSTVRTNGAVFEREQPQPILSVVTLSVPHSNGDYQVYDIHPKGQGYLVTTVSASPQATAISSPDPVGTLVIAKGWVKGLR
jgi:Tol biopolymer transport system component